MLKLKNIIKEYPTGSEKVVALKGVTLNFRRSEFVSILGQSGCGKTTLLNIIGGLDQYTDGDLVIEGKSTKDFKASDWDNYRNHRVGFVFQSYNLIPHQSVLANVELALTLSGVSKSERRARAKEALEKVGLSDQISKKPNQLSGGQMQRVAIARALVNDPEILLADEPTGALDSETSVQVMDILREISENRLVIMVTHNPELAEEYSTRIIRLLDGNVIDDSAPYSDEEEAADSAQAAEKAAKKSKGKKKPSMSFFTALSLSLNNLLTKKMRTFLTSFAGSIGIIGIALILSLSSGFQAYIDSIQRETLTSYPVTIDAATMDMNSMLGAMANFSSSDVEHELDKVYSNTMSQNMLQSYSSGVWFNDLAAFKKFIEKNDEFKSYVSSVQYQYGGKMNIYSADVSEGANQVYPSPVLDMMQSMMGGLNLGSMGIDTSTIESYSSLYNSWQELIDNKDLLRDQYDLIEGAWPAKYNEAVLIIDKNNEISDLTIQGLGIMNSSEIMNMMMEIMKGGNVETKKFELDYDEIIGRKFKIVIAPDFFKYDEEAKEWLDMSGDEEFVKEVIGKSEDLTIVGIIRPSEDSVAVNTMGTIGYLSDLVTHVAKKTEEAEIVKKQKADPEVDVFTGIPFPKAEETEADKKAAADNKTKESETKKTETKPVDTFEKPVVSSLALAGETPRASFTANELPDMSSLPSYTEEEVYALIDQNYSGEEAAKMKRTVELMLKNVLSISERRELTANLNEMLSGYEIPGYGTISGDQAMTYLSMMDRNTKLKMLGAMASGAYQNMPLPEETPQDETEAGDEKGEEPEDGEETQAEPEPEPEPEPLAGSYDEALEMLGVADLNNPKQINIYPKDFESKDEISRIIEEYNESCEEEKAIKYTDFIGVMLKSVTKIVNIISYVLIAFVAISLVVSSIMIGIITYISVLERTKEIGILRAIGASKRDISRVFNAETLTVGFVSGAIGIGVTLLLIIPINFVIKYLTSLPHVAQLPPDGAIALILISMFLTFIAGLIPARIAANKDPVVALRTE